MWSVGKGSRKGRAKHNLYMYTKRSEVKRHREREHGCQTGHTGFGASHGSRQTIISVSTIDPVLQIDCPKKVPRGGSAVSGCRLPRVLGALLVANSLAELVQYTTSLRGKATCFVHAAEPKSRQASRTSLGGDWSARQTALTQVVAAVAATSSSGLLPRREWLFHTEHLSGSGPERRRG